jgi:hypothetical protein
MEGKWLVSHVSVTHCLLAAKALAFPGADEKGKIEYLRVRRILGEWPLRTAAHQKQ